jgi:hypothetical protein
MMVHSIAILRTDPCSRARQAWCLGATDSLCEFY